MGRSMKIKTGKELEVCDCSQLSLVILLRWKYNLSQFRAFNANTLNISSLHV